MPDTETTPSPETPAPRPVRTLAELRAEARQHALQLESVRFLTVQDLAARWKVDDDTVRRVPREQLPYLTFGKSRTRRYDPRLVARYEREAQAA